MSLVANASTIAVLMAGLFIGTGPAVGAAETMQTATVSAPVTHAATGNAALVWYRVFLLLPKDAPQETTGHWKVLLRIQPSLSAAAEPWLDKAFATRPRWLRLADHAVAIPAADWGVDFAAEGFETPVPQLGSVREWARLAAIHAVWAAMHERPDEAIEDITAIEALGEHLGRGGTTTIEGLIGTSIADMGFGATAAVLSRLPRSQRASLAHRFASIPAEPVFPALFAKDVRTVLATLETMRALPLDQRAARLGDPDLKDVGVITDGDLDRLRSDCGAIAARVAEILAGDPASWRTQFDTLSAIIPTMHPLVARVIPTFGICLGMEVRMRLTREIVIRSLGDPDAPPVPVDGHPVTEVRTSAGDRLWSWRVDPTGKESLLWMPGPNTPPWASRPGATPPAATPGGDTSPVAPAAANDF